MPHFPAPILRALAGLVDGSGRTIAIAGPPVSGKSGLLEELAAELKGAGHRVVSLRGEYRNRGASFSGLAGLVAEEDVASEEEVDEEEVEGVEVDEEGGATSEDDSGSTDRGAGDAPGLRAIPPPPLAFAEPELARSRRTRGGRRGVILGQTFVTRSLPAESRDARAYWSDLIDEFRRGSEHAVAILVEDAVYIDPESRSFLLALTDLARLRPLLLVYVLDSSTPSYGSWEERLLGRGDVDWVKFARPKPDPREIHAFKEAFDHLPPTTQRVLGYAALMGGHVSEVSLSRVTRMTWRQLAEALLPASEAKLVKIEAAKVIVPHDAWVEVLPDLLPEEERRDMHREIAEALAALNPEPNVLRRLELAGHYFDWNRGPHALRYLLETAELTERLSAFDTAIEVLDKALTCVPSLPTGDRPEAVAELRIFLARVLMAAGRPSEGVEALREGLNEAFHGGLPQERLEEWIEETVPLLRAVGPRPGFVTTLVELADRCHDAGATGAEVLLQSILAEYEVDRNHPEKARGEAIRAAQLARGLGRGPVQAVALLAVGLSRVEGSSEEQRLAERFLKSAEVMLGSARRYELQQLAEEVHIRLLEERGETHAALRAHERAVSVAQRMRALATELSHQIGIAALIIDQPSDIRATSAIRRAHEIVELLHLLPPSPGLVRLWLLEGRLAARSQAEESARDRWSAIIDIASPAVPPRLRAEAILRLAALEAGGGRPEEARHLLARLETRDLEAALRPEWLEWRREIWERVGPEIGPPGPTP
ncbi:MAG: AAA family ATPase [Thermoplasmata archaeon]